MSNNHPISLFIFLAVAGVSFAQDYDLLLQGGHVIDPKNSISAVRDVAIKDGKVAAVAPKIDASAAFKTVDVKGLYVMPGLVDIHAHVYAGTGEPHSYAGDNSVYPDGFTFRSGVTTVADAGCAGWRNFEDFKNRVIDRSRTRVLALINIVGNGMRGGQYEQSLPDMEVKPTADMALKYPGLIVGVKSAHYGGNEWDPYERAVEVGKIANIPVMVDFGSGKDRPIGVLFSKYFRPGDIYTHCYAGGGRGEVTPEGRINPAIFEAKKNGIIFDVGHGGGSFYFRTAVQAFKEGYYPDSLSTDLHIGSMNTGMKDMANLMGKFLALGMKLDDVVLRSTWNPAKEIKHEELGNLSVGAPADVAVFRLENGDFGFIDQAGARLKGKQRLTAEITIRDGKIVWDLNGLARPDWDTLPKDYRSTGDPRWDAYSGGGGRGPRERRNPAPAK